MVPFIIFLILVIIYITWNYFDVRAREQWKETLKELNDEELIEEAEKIRSEREFMSYDEYFDRTDSLRKEFESRGLKEKFDRLDI